jgi:hypothetical protein
MLAYDPATGLAVVPSTFIDGIYTIQLLDPAGIDPDGPENSAGLVAGHLQAAPLPVGERVRLSFTLAETRALTATVHDVNGRTIRTLASGVLGAGAHELSWDRKDDSGRRVEPGVYFVRISGETQVFARKLVVAP